MGMCALDRLKKRHGRTHKAIQGAELGYHEKVPHCTTTVGVGVGRLL